MDEATPEIVVASPVDAAQVAIAQADVERAEVHAAAEVEIATVQAEAAVQIAEAAAETVTEEVKEEVDQLKGENEWLKTELMTIRQTQAEMAEALTLVMAALESLTASPSTTPEPSPEEPPVTVETVESPESVAESPEAKTEAAPEHKEPPRKRHRLL